MAMTKKPISGSGIPPRPAASDEPTSTPPPQPKSVTRQDREDYDQPVLTPDEQYDEVIYGSKESSTLDPGRYEAILDEVIGLPMKDTGGFIRAVFIIADPDPKLMGRRHPVLFQMVQDDGRKPGEWGPVFYHRMMAKLGYPKENRGKEARQEVSKEKPGVYLKITAGKQEGFVNTAVEGRFEQDNDNIEALRTWLENAPY